MTTKAEGKRKELAKYSRQAWVRWMEHILEISVSHPDGNLTIPRTFVDRWRQQIKTSFDDLSTREKSADFAEADLLIEVIDGIEDITVVK